MVRMTTEAAAFPPFHERPPVVTEAEYGEKLKWLMFFRLLFTLLLLGSTVVLHIREKLLAPTPALIGLYELIGGLFLLSIVYTVLLTRLRRLKLFAYFQVAVDSLMVTFIIFLTGSFASFFSFLYLVVIMYASMILSKAGGIIMAALCGIQYGILVDLEYYGFIDPYGMSGAMSASDHPWNIVIYKILSIIVACFAVAFLSGILAEQAHRTRRELRVMENHVKRVERMAGIGEMAAGLAHEIKNPLASLRGAIQFLQEDLACDEGQRHLMSIVLREADRLNSLVGDFLLFARPPAGHAEIMNLSEALSEIVTMFQRDQDRNAALITTNIAPGISGRMDPNHLRQILWNLLLNAAEAVGEEGRVHVELRVGRDGDSVIAIHDNGQGIEPERLATIFDPFVTSKPNGTGLGLSIVHRLLENHGGVIDVQSEPGQGSVFTIRLKPS